MIDCLPDAFGNAWRIGRNRSDGRALLFREEFHMFSIYLTEDTQFLIINDTAVNNNTLIRCSGSQSALARETRLNVYSKLHVLIDYDNITVKPPKRGHIAISVMSLVEAIHTFVKSCLA